jgi:hypothetical protein
LLDFASEIKRRQLAECPLRHHTIVVSAATWQKPEKSQKVPIKKLQKYLPDEIVKIVKRLMSAACLGMLESVHV